MDRKIVASGLLLTGLLVAMPALAQDQPYQWTSDRPDGHAPAGVKMDYTLPAGDLYVGYRYSQEKYEGTLVGTQSITDQEVLDFFTSAPLTHDQSIGELDLRLGLGIGTLEVSMPWVRNEMLNETSTVFYESASEVLGDVSIRGLFNVVEQDEYRLSLSLGATLPTGKIGKKGTTATLTKGVLPYAMQGGSGSVDVLAGGTFLVQNEVASIGAQLNSVIRVVDNRKDYRLGDEFGFSVWGAYNITDWVSVSLRGLFEHQSDITGSDPRLDGSIDPLANSFAQGGERVLIPIGMNLYFRDGAVAGHRLSLEYYYPVHEDLNGPQLSTERTLVASWQTIF